MTAISRSSRFLFDVAYEEWRLGHIRRISAIPRQIHQYHIPAQGRRSLSRENRMTEVMK